MSAKGQLTRHRAPALLIAGALCLPLATAPAAQADPLTGGIIGGIGGLAVGGLLGGGGGAAAGALVGGFGGALIGAERQRRREISRPIRVSEPQQPQRVVAQRNLVAGIQSELTQKGYDPGGVDGRIGPNTRNAISAYQQANGLLVTGQPSQALLDHIRNQGVTSQ